MRIAKLFISATVTVISASAAIVAHAQTIDPTSSFNWSGPYIGFNAGDDYDGATRFDRTSGSLVNNTSALTLGLRPSSHAVQASNFVGGAQIGYNYELGNRFGLASMGMGGVVVGAEADADYTDIHHTDTLSNTTNYGALDTLGSTPTVRVNQYQGDLDFLGTVRGRVGYAFGRTLIYGTGGYAYGDVERRTTYFGPNAPTTPYFTGESNGMRSGVAYGGGIEFAMPAGSFPNLFHSSGMTIKAEYLHYDLGSDTLNFPGVNGGATIGGYTSRVRTNGDIARVGVNYKF